MSRPRKKHDPLLRLQPWRMFAVYAPIERILHRLETDGTVDVAGRQIVFKEDSSGSWYDALAALRGVAEFHRIAAIRYNIPVDVDALFKFAARLDAGMPIFEEDIAAVRASIESCRRQAGCLRVSQAESIIKTVRIGEELEKRKAA